MVRATTHPAASTGTLRRLAVMWTYAAIAVHLLVGLLLPWLASAELLAPYHAGIVMHFWQGSVPPAALAHQQWWMALFGPTVQAAAVWMGALAYLGDRERSAFAWGALIAGLVLWAPQDILISLKAACWPNVWIDCIALVAMLPPLIYLFITDRKAASHSGRTIHRHSDRSEAHA